MAAMASQLPCQARRGSRRGHVHGRCAFQHKLTSFPDVSGIPERALGLRLGRREPKESHFLLQLPSHVITSANGGSHWVPDRQERRQTRCNKGSRCIFLSSPDITVRVALSASPGPATPWRRTRICSDASESRESAARHMIARKKLL